MFAGRNTCYDQPGAVQREPLPTLWSVTFLPYIVAMRLIMFSPRRRGLGRRVRVWLVLPGIVSIAGLFALISSPDFTRASLEPVRQALAQSDPAAPTLVPVPNPTAGL